MAKKKKKKKGSGYKDGMMKKVSGKGETYEGHEPLLKSGNAIETTEKPLNPETYNRADAALAMLKSNTGYRQKVRLK